MAMDRDECKRDMGVREGETQVCRISDEHDGTRDGGGDALWTGDEKLMGGEGEGKRRGEERRIWEEKKQWMG